MAEKNGETGSGPDPSREKISAGTLSTVGWSLFLIWLGIVLLVKFSMGIVMLGVGGITLGMQMARKYFGLDFARPWVAVGLIFASGRLVWLGLLVRLVFCIRFGAA